MLIKKIIDGETELAQIYDLSNVTETSFPTDNNCSFQFGIGFAETDKKFKTHIHKNAERIISNTSEFIFVLEGGMKITFLNNNHEVVDIVDIGPNMAFLQHMGGHAIEASKETKYFELKQGPYVGRDFDKYDVELPEDSQ